MGGKSVHKWSYLNGIKNAAGQKIKAMLRLEAG